MTTVPATAAPAGAITIEMAIDTTRACPPAPGCPYYSPVEINATAGTIVLYLANTSDAQHNILIGPAIGSPIAASPKVYGQRAVILTIEDVPAGSYAFWCTIDNGYGPHFERGMVGSLIVDE